MKIEIDGNHARLLDKALADGRAADPQAYVESLIHEDMAASVEHWEGEDREGLEALLLERLDGPFKEREPGDTETLRREVLAIVEQRRVKRS